MKKLCITFLALTIIMLSAIGLNATTTIKTKEYLRIHIRANSNSPIDQDVKYQIKDFVVAYLTPIIAECNTKSKAQTLLSNSLEGVEDVADNVLKNKGFSYKSNAKLCKENFPTRTYGELVLESGYYDSLIIELGDGKGDNWWCVVYPPLCFVGDGSGYLYKSKILKIIQDFYKDD